MQILYIISVFLGLISAIALMISPATGYLYVMLFKPVIDTGFYVHWGPGLSLTRFYGVAIPSIVIFHILINSKEERRMRHMPLSRMWLAYSFYVLYFSMFIVYGEGIVEGLDVCFRYLNGIIGFYMMQAYCREDEKFKKLIIVLIIASIFPLFSTLYQIVTGVQWHKVDFMVSMGFTRYAGFYHHIATIRYYVYQTIIVLLLYRYFVAAPRAISMLVGSSLGSLALICIYKTYSKAGYLTIALWFLVWFIFSKKYKSLLVVSLILLLTSPLYLPHMLDVTSTVYQKELDAVSGRSGEAVYFTGRISRWESSLSKWSKLSFFKQTFGSGAIALGEHNDYMSMLWHGGIVGLLLYVSLLFMIGIKLMIELWKKADPLLVAAIMLFLAYLIDTVGLVPSLYPHFQWLVWGIIGLSLRRREDQRLAFQGQVRAWNKIESSSKSKADA